ncbi:MAG TPA: TolC family protein [Steroidobacteraceae bacterium]|nr:TolC family protein [Steroidobacteraceae bacterium]
MPRTVDLHSAVSQLDAQIPGSKGLAQGRIDLSRPLSPGEIGVLAILNSPDLRALRGGRALAQAQLLQNSLLPNPSGTINYEALLGGEGTGPAWAVSLTEDINALVTYHARAKAARLAADQVDADQLWQQWQAAQQARLLAVDLYWGGQAIATSEREGALIESEIRDVRKAVDANNLDYSALSPLLANQASLEQSLVALRTSQLTAWQGLDALLGLKPDVRFALAPPDALPDLTDVDALVDSLPQRRPDLIALQLGLRSSDESVRAALLGRFPKFVLGPIWEEDTTKIRSAGPTATFDLPIFDRNQGQVAIARATREQLLEQYQARLDATVGQVRGLLALEQRTVEDLQGVRAAGETATQLSSNAQHAYHDGNIDLRTLTDFQTAALERSLEITTLERTLAETQVSLAVDLGLGLPTTSLLTPAPPLRGT